MNKKDYSKQKVSKLENENLKFVSINHNVPPCFTPPNQWGCQHKFVFYDATNVKYAIKKKSLMHLSSQQFRCK